MISKRLLMLSVMLLGLWLSGCGPQWRVITQASPNPFLGKREFVVLPATYNGLRVGDKSEAEYLSAKKDKSVDSFQEDKAAMADRFMAVLRERASKHGLRLATGGEVTTFVIKANVISMEPGFYTYFVNKPSTVIMRIRIENKDGKLLDEVEIQHSTGASMVMAASGSRYRSDADGLGRITADYLSARAHGQEP